MHERFIHARRDTSDARRPYVASLLVVAIASVSTLASAADPTRGEQLYRQLCADCHGGKGEGSEFGYEKPLVGDRPLSDLARVISETMPEGEPEKVTGDDAAAVAAYIYDAFYSEDAQLRNAPPRIELSRLTNRQYQNAITDLVGSFMRPGAAWGDERGLEAEYYNDRRPRRDKRVIERIDPNVNFDFGTESPDAEKIEPYEFSIKWEGSVFAPDTGEYEFIVRSDQATRLWVNNTEEPLIDAYVKSGDDTEFRKTIHLLGGRAYPLRLEFSKAKQGVDDKKAKEQPPKPAMISLHWKRPHHTEEVIPERCLAPIDAATLFVVDTPFPPDDRSMGYERGTSVSKQWDEATTSAALQVAGYIATNLRRFADAPRDASDEEKNKKLREFGAKFVERAFRRPLTDEQRQLFVERQFDEAPDPETAIKRVVLLSLKSPRFLYREISTPDYDAYDVASRLSFGLWDSLPDQKLLDAAAQGKLGTADQIREQAERMVSDVRTESKLRDFLQQWLGLDRMHDLAKDAELYPEFNDELASDLRTSMDLFIQDVISGEKADFRRLLLDDSIPLNGRLAKFYGVDLPEDAPFQKVAFEPERRAGALTHPYLLSGLAYYGTSSPIHRGVFVSRSVLGRVLAPPPEAVSPLAPDLHPDLTTRQRVEKQTSPATCQSCHAMVNPLGFPLEHFDAVGRFRDEEKGKPIDATGSYLTQQEETVQFQGARELATFLSGSPETHEAFVEKLFNYTMKQPVRAYGPERLSELRHVFAENGFDIRRLVTEMVTVAAMPTDESKE